MVSKKSIVLLSFSLSFGFLILLPLLKYGFGAAYFIIDPEAVYIANALSYIRTHNIYYAEHPGTPTILFLVMSYWPFRIYAKIFEHQSFISWVFDNIDLVFIYSRLINNIVFTLSLLIFSSSIFKFTKSYFSILYFYLAVMCFSFIPRLGVEVIPETLSLFITAIWSYFFIKFLDSKSLFSLFILNFLSGIVFANKFTNVLLVIISLSLIYCLKEIDWKKRLKIIFVNMSIIVIGFLLGTWPVRHIYLVIFEWGYRIISHTGMWGQGSVGFFDFVAYKEVFINLIKSNCDSMIVAIIAIVIFSYANLFRKSKYDTIYQITFYSSFLIGLFFMKYPRIHYILIPYVVMVLVSSLVFYKLPLLLKTVSTIILILLFVRNINEYFLFIDRNISDSVRLQKYVQANSFNSTTLWDYGKTKEFVFIWIRDWTQGIFDEELRTKRSDLLELKSDYDTVLLDHNNYTNVFNVCWETLFIRANRGNIFINKHDEMNFKSEMVDESDIMAIKSNHCDKSNQYIKK